MEYAITLLTALLDNAPLLVGFILPPLVEVLNRDVSNPKERLIVSLLTCFVVAVTLHWREIAYGSPEQVLAFSGIIFTESQLTFKLYFADSWAREKIQQKVGSVNASSSPVVQ